MASPIVHAEYEAEFAPWPIIGSTTVCASPMASA